MDKELLRQVNSECIEDGDELGFQFSVKCPSCKEQIYSGFVEFHGTKSKSLFKKNDDADKDWNEQKRNAFHDACEYFEDILVYCNECGKYVCETCWVNERDMCMACCTMSAKKVLDESWYQAQANMLDQEKCPKCGAKVGKAKFCPKCGEKQKIKGVCEYCSARIPEDALFCPECGKKTT